MTHEGGTGKRRRPERKTRLRPCPIPQACDTGCGGRCRVVWLQGCGFLRTFRVHGGYAVFPPDRGGRAVIPEQFRRHMERVRRGGRRACLRFLRGWKRSGFRTGRERAGACLSCQFVVRGGCAEDGPHASLEQAISGGSPFPEMSPLSARMMARSITLRSSRTLPGHE